MWKVFIAYCLLLVIFNTSGFGQSFTLDELIKIRAMDAETAHNYLSSKGWKFSKASEETVGYYSSSTWSYGQTAYSDRAKAFITLFIKEGFPNKVSYQTISKSHYDIIKAKILSYKMKRISSKVNDGQISSTYEGDNYKIDLDIGSEDYTNIPTYNVMLYKKPPAVSEYDVLFNKYLKEEIKNNELSNVPKGEKVLSDAQISYYKNLIEKYEFIPQDKITNDYSSTGQTYTKCNLVVKPINSNTSSNTIKVIDASSKVFILSKLPKEWEHDYFLVYVNGYVGYLNRHSIKEDI